MNFGGQRIRNWLSETHPTAFSAYCITAAFGTYFCMYAFRKPFTAAEFKDMVWLGIGFKTILIASQVTGYTISKFIGIKVVSEMPARYRAITILGLIAVAEAALLLFALTPMPWNFVWLFVNGLPLGMVFGLVLGFLEGRKVSESLAAGLCASFIISSGVVKSTGRALVLDYGVSEHWMPFLTGLIFIAPLGAFVWLLSQIPPPSAEDQSLRCERKPMDRDARRGFFKRHAVGLISFLAIYTMLTVVRGIRGDFAVEIWAELGVSDQAEVFAESEFWVMLGVISVTGSAILIRNNRSAFLGSIGLLSFGFALVIAAVVGQTSQTLTPMQFMIALGLGLYIPYVSFHTTVFERMIAAFRETGTVGYLMYLADAIGYLGLVAVLIFKNTASNEVRFLPLLLGASVFVAVVSSAISLALLIYYSKNVPKTDPEITLT